MKLFDNKTGTGWKQPNKKTGQGWTYYENNKVKVPGTDAIESLQLVLDKGKKIYNSVRDTEAFKFIGNQLNEMARYQGEAALLRGETTVEGSRAIVDTISDDVTSAFGSAVDLAEIIIDESSQIPSRWTFHPNCLETFGELCTHREYNKRMQRRFKEQTWDHYSTYIPGSGGID